MIVVLWLGVCLLPSFGPARAATIKGRVVDSAGRPVAGAEVRIWQKLSDAGGVIVDKQANFGDGDVLITDAEGRFAAPDVLASKAFAFVVGEATGMLAGRSGWIEIGKDADATAPDVALKRLRAVTGQVRDRHGQPVAGATVFNSGDGHQRVEAKTGRNGKFFLDGVPEGPAFLFVEKPGYRFTGVQFPAGQSVADFTLASVEETVEPLATLPPLLSAEEEMALARRVLDPWLEEVLKSGTDVQKLVAVANLAHVDPPAALRLFDSLNIQDKQRMISRDTMVMLAIERSARLSSEQIPDLIESGEDDFRKIREYVAAARQLDDSHRPRQLEWLDAALAHARHIDDSTQRTWSLARVADALFSIGRQDRAEATLVEAEKSAEAAPQNPRALGAFAALTLACAHVAPARAREHLEKYTDPLHRQAVGSLLAVKLLPTRPDDAVALWPRTGARPSYYRLHGSSLVAYCHFAEFCYRLAAVDLPRAEGLAGEAEDAGLRLIGKGAIVLALAVKQPIEARKLLESLVRDDLPRLATQEEASGQGWSPSTTAAWLLPIAERVAPDLCREIFWRSVALRPPRPRRDDLDDESEITQVELVKMLARYDRGVARALFEPLASRTAELTSPGGTQLDTRHALAVAQFAWQWAHDLITAAVHIDPHWAKELIAIVPDGPAGARYRTADGARQAFVRTLALHGPDRWQEGNSVCAAFWQPRSDNELDY